VQPSAIIASKMHGTFIVRSNIHVPLSGRMSRREGRRRTSGFPLNHAQLRIVPVPECGSAACGCYPVKGSGIQGADWARHRIFANWRITTLCVRTGCRPPGGRTNSAALFRGDTALALMCTGRLGDTCLVWQYQDAECSLGPNEAWAELFYR